MLYWLKLARVNHLISVILCFCERLSLLFLPIISAILLVFCIMVWFVMWCAIFDLVWFSACGAVGCSLVWSSAVRCAVV